MKCAFLKDLIVGLHFGSKKTGKISLIFKELAVFFLTEVNSKFIGEKAHTDQIGSVNDSFYFYFFFVSRDEK